MVIVLSLQDRKIIHKSLIDPSVEHSYSAKSIIESLTINHYHCILYIMTKK